MKIYFNIKNELKAIVFMLLSLSVLSSCKKYLDVVPNELVTEDKIWGNINNANGALANLYSGLPTGITPNGEDVDEITAATDESFHHWGAGYWSLKYNVGAWNSVDNPFGNWTEQYQKIRKANIFLENIDKVPIPGDQATYYAIRIPHYKAEARFLRAMFYFELLKRYGAVPILTKSYSIKDNAEELKTIARNSVDEVVSFIVSECEAVAPLLLTVHPDAELGRINKGAALALAAKTLLYAASPLFNGNPIYAAIKNKDGKQLFSSSYDNEKWKKAADAAKKVLDHYNNAPLPRAYGNDDINSYAAIFNTREWTETILAFNLPKNKVLDLSLNAYGGPFGGWGKYSPLQELVDSYEMKNGFPINHTGSGYQKDGFWTDWFWGGDGTNAWVYLENVSNRFKNRDPRFYATISFQNSKWSAVRTKNPIRLAYWGGNNGVSQAWPKSSGTYTVSGYNVRKWLDPKVDPTNWWTSPDAQRNYPIFRLAEFYLAYAEALNEYNGGPTAEAFSAINKVRARVSMPGLPVSGVGEDNTQVGFRKRVQNENRIEFAFEAHRFWDVRRWLIAETVDNGPVHGLNARPTTAELTATGLDPQSEAAGLAAFYKEAVIQNRIFVKRHYLMPIPQGEMDVNKELVQNYGW